MKKYSCLIIFIFIYISLYAQQKKGSALYGVGAFYNFQNKGASIDLRAKFPIVKNLYVSPRFSYYPAFNNIHEYYAGTDIDFHMPLKRKLIPYVFAGGYYNNWINSSDYHNTKSKKNNFAFEAGAGLLLTYKCFYPFLEYRYDAKWKEGLLGAGLMLKIGECMNTSISRATKCPRF